MTKRTAFLTRCLAMVLALVLVMSNVAPGLTLRASAADGFAFDDAGLMFRNYEQQITAAEGELLLSGYLKSESHTYAALETEGLVTVDADSKTIAAGTNNGWTPVSATISSNGEVVETVALTNGVGTYAYDGLAFSVTVGYELAETVSADVQNKLLNAHTTLKQAVKNMDAGINAEGNLGAVVDAVPVLKQLTDDADMVDLCDISDATINAVNNLEAQIESVRGMNAAYEAAASKLAYAMINGASYKGVVALAHEYLAEIAGSKLLTHERVEEAIELQDEIDGTNNLAKWRTFKEILKNLIADLEAVVNADWSVLNADLIAENADYGHLETLINAISATSAVAVTEKLMVDTASVTVASDNAMVVSVHVIVEYVNGNNELVNNGAAAEVTVAKDATEADVAAAIAATTLEADLLAEVIAYNDIDYTEEHFYCSLEAYDADEAIYNIVYTPNHYMVTFSYAEAAEYPYGYAITLEQPADGLTSYDYTVNGEAYTDSTYVIVGDTEISRVSGKAWKTTDLYKVIGQNFGNEQTAAILESGALTGNVSFKVREPDAADSSLLSLDAGVLTAPNYPSDYEGLEWVPYSYGKNGTENLFNGKNTVNCTDVTVKVIYRLYLPGFEGRVAGVLSNADAMIVDAQAQLEALAILAEDEYYNEMATLTRQLMSTFKGAVGGTDFITPDTYESIDSAENLEVQDYFNAIIDSIIKNNCEGKSLRLYNMMTEYRKESGGLRYYYNNAAALKEEVASLSKNLDGMVGDPVKEAQLAILLDALGYSEYVEKIANIGETMKTVNEGLTLPNSMINLNSSKIGSLITALNMTCDEANKPAGVPYLESVGLNAKDSSTVNVQAIVSIEGERFYVGATDPVTRGDVVSAESIKALEAEVHNAVSGKLGESLKYYTRVISEGSMDALAGQSLTENAVFNINYALKQFTVKVEGAADQYVTVRDLEYELPAHPDYPSFSYVYTVAGETKEPGIYTFTMADLDAKFTDGAITITREQTNVGADDFNDVYEDMTDKDTTGNKYEPIVAENGAIQGLKVTVKGDSSEGLMSFAQNMLLDGYNYINFYNDQFLYEKDNYRYVSLKAMLDAMMYDPGFGSERLIALAQNNGGVLLTVTDADLSNVNMVLDEEIQVANANAGFTFEEKEFTIVLDGVPSQLVTVGNALNAVKSYMSFQAAGDGKNMNVTLNLPDPVYEAYLTALVITDDLDRLDINAMNNKIAFQFFKDYLDEILAQPEITADTYENTLNMLIREFNDLSGKDVTEVELSAYNDLYAQLVKNLNDEKNVKIVTNEDDMTVTFRIFGEQIEKIMTSFIDDKIGIYGSLVTIEERENPDAVVETNVITTLSNALVDYEAAVVDVANHGGVVKTVSNAFDCVADLSARLAAQKGPGIVQLLDEVNSDLTFNHATILDLNGKTINGNIVANGKVVIIDSMQDTRAAGYVNGTVSGDVIVLAGHYTSNVESFLKDGYYVEDGVVLNALFECVGGNYVIDTDFIYSDYVDGYLPAIHYLAAELVVDIALNYYPEASLTIDDNDIYAYSFDDLVGMLGADSNKEKAANLIDDLLAIFRFDNVDGSPEGGIDGFINDVIADLLDLENISNALKTDSSIGDYQFTIHPWSIDLDYVADGDYITVGVVPNYERTRTFNIGLTLKGVDNAKLLAVLDEMARILADDTSIKVDLHQPVREGQTLVIGGGADAFIHLDFSHNSLYNNLLAMILAYGNDRLNEQFELDGTWVQVKKGCVIRLNDVMATTTVGEFFTAMMNIAEAKPEFSAIADKLGIDLSAQHLAKMEELYDVFLNGAAKVLAKLELDVNPATPIAELAEKDYFVFDGKINARSGDAHYKGYGIEVNFDGISAALKITLADKCTAMWGDVNSDWKVNAMDSTRVLRYTVRRITAEDIHLCMADVNGDGRINAMDATQILRYTVKYIDKFPAEK